MALRSLITRSIGRNTLKTAAKATGLRWLSTATSAEFSLPGYQLHKLDSAPPTSTSVTRDEFLHYYREMSIIREMENNARDMYREKNIRGFLHLCIGQEACCVGMEAGMSSEDPVITAYRCHGWTYTRGVPVKNILAELTGKSTGCAKGKGGSMHMYAPNFYGGNGIVGAQVPLGAGIALALKYNDKKNVCVTAYGDGAANQGQVFEAYNMASLWDLPCLFVCENNHYGMGTSKQRSSASTDYYTRGDYIPGIKVDGMNVLSIREATKWAAEYILKNETPLVMELDTYRYYGHSMSDPGKSYRDASEVKEVRKERDPITGSRALILQGNLATEEELDKIDQEAEAHVQEAVAFALSGSELPPEELYTNIFTSTPNEPVRGCDPFTYGSSVSATA